MDDEPRTVRDDLVSTLLVLSVIVYGYVFMRGLWGLVLYAREALF